MYYRNMAFDLMSVKLTILEQTTNILLCEIIFLPSIFLSSECF